MTKLDCIAYLSGRVRLQLCLEAPEARTAQNEVKLS